MAHIHQGTPGVNGGVGVWLFPSTTPGNGPLGAGPFNGRIVDGTFTADELRRPVRGHDDRGRSGRGSKSGGAYVNVHTNDGVAPTSTGPGDFPGGEIRADI